MTDIRWDAMPPEIRKAAEPIINRYAWLLPTWCHVLTVGYENTADTSSVATCDAEPEYRQARIAINQAWLEQSAGDRRAALVHELAHLVVAPLAKFAESMVEKLFNEPAKSIMDEQFRVAMESTVEDFAAAVHGRRT